MYCPVCGTKPLKREDLESNLQVGSCGECGGTWISAKSYYKWLETPKQPAGELVREKMLVEVHDTQKALLCPDCGRFLIKYRVGRGLDFNLDRCGGCRGVWLDNHEWDALKTRGLHDELHRILSMEWQKQTQQEEHMKRMRKMYSEKFGEADYERLRDIRAWLESHPNRAAMLGYLNDKDPYDL